MPSEIEVKDLSESLPSSPGPEQQANPEPTGEDKNAKAVEECREILNNFRVPLCNNVIALDMLKHLQMNMVIDVEKAKQIRRTGKSINADTNQAILDELLTRGLREFEVYQKGLRKFNLTLLADLLEQKHFSKLMPILDPVSQKLGHHWKRLALEMGMAGIIPKVETKYTRLREQALYSLLIWEDTSGVAATEKRLMDALDACGMKKTIAYMKKLSGKKGKKKKGGKKKGKGSGKPGTGKKR